MIVSTKNSSIKLDGKVAGNIFPTKQAIANYLGIGVNELIPKITKA